MTKNDIEMYSGRAYNRIHNQIHVFSSANELIFTIRCPTEEEAMMVMEDLDREE